METFGPKFTKVDIKLQSVSLSLLSGSGNIKGLVVGNPEGYKTPQPSSSAKLPSRSSPVSLLSDKIVIKSINVQGPEITYETDLSHNNLSKILSNLQEATSGGRKEPAKPQEPGQPKCQPAKDSRWMVYHRRRQDSRERDRSGWWNGNGSSAGHPPPGSRQGPDGITPAELIKTVLEAIKKGAGQAASGAMTDIGKGAVYVTKDLGNTGTNTLQKVTKGIGGLFKKN